MWFLARLYDAQQALQMGLVNTVVPLARLEEETTVWWAILYASRARKNGTNGFKCRDASQAGLRGHSAGAAQVPGDHAQ